MTDATPTLERTSAEIRDKAVSEARTAEGILAEVCEMLRLTLRYGADNTRGPATELLKRLGRPHA